MQAFLFYGKIKILVRFLCPAVQNCERSDMQSNVVWAILKRRTGPNLIMSLIQTRRQSRYWTHQPVSGALLTYLKQTEKKLHMVLLQWELLAL